MRVKLTDAQVGALQCRDGGGLDPATLRAWNGGSWLVFEEADRAELLDEICEASNCEDAQAEECRRRRQRDPGARGAATALFNLSRRIAAAR